VCISWTTQCLNETRCFRCRGHSYKVYCVGRIVRNIDDIRILFIWNIPVSVTVTMYITILMYTF